MNTKFRRTILTAAHCICDTRESLSISKEIGMSLAMFTTCRLPFRKKSKPTNRLNQHIKLEDDNGSPLKSSDVEIMWDKERKTKMQPFNHMDVKIGSRDYTTGVFQGAKYAYVMYVKEDTSAVSDNPLTITKELSGRPDIGLIVLEREIRRKGKYLEGHVAPLCLPTR